MGGMCRERDVCRGLLTIEGKGVSAQWPARYGFRDGRRVLVPKPKKRASHQGSKHCLFRSVPPELLITKSPYLLGLEMSTGTNDTSLVPIKTPVSYPFKPGIPLNFVLKYREIQYEKEGIMKALNGDRRVQAYQPVG